MKVYHNTTNLTGNTLKECIRDALRQEDKVMQYFNRHTKATPSDVHGGLVKEGIINWNTPITSIRRAITNLMKDGRLKKTDEMKPGIFTKPEHFYILTDTWAPILEGNQICLF